jgi:hypothetical protein
VSGTFTQTLGRSIQYTSYCPVMRFIPSENAWREFTTQRCSGSVLALASIRTTYTTFWLVHHIYIVVVSLLVLAVILLVGLTLFFRKRNQYLVVPDYGYFFIFFLFDILILVLVLNLIFLFLIFLFLIFLFLIFLFLIFFVFDFFVFDFCF